MIADPLHLPQNIACHVPLAEKTVCLDILQANPVFLDKVTTWQRKLGTMDLVLSTWADMQKKWQALVSIFLGSADIREQLPEDSLRFDSVNAAYMVLPNFFVIISSMASSLARQAALHK